MTVSHAMPSESSKVKHFQKKCIALMFVHTEWSRWIPWIFSQYYVW